MKIILILALVLFMGLQPVMTAAADFGMDRFSAGSDEFSQDIDLDPNIIRAGDKLNVQVYREKDQSGTFIVYPSGMMNYPLLGEIYVDGLTLEELKKFLTESLGKYFISPQVQIDFEESPNKSVSMLGQVGKPGNYLLTPNLTLVRLISQVGGFTLNANTSAVKVVRKAKSGKKKYMDVDVQKIMEGKAEDFELLPGDMIYVDQTNENKATARGVSILGQIVKPGNYTYSEGMTLMKLISEAGGFTAIAAPNRVKIVRKAKTGGISTKVLDVRKVMDGKEEDLLLEPNDLLVVPESFF